MHRGLTGRGRGETGLSPTRWDAPALARTAGTTENVSSPTRGDAPSHGHEPSTHDSLSPTRGDGPFIWNPMTQQLEYPTLRAGDAPFSGCPARSLPPVSPLRVGDAPVMDDLANNYPSGLPHPRVGCAGSRPRGERRPPKSSPCVWLRRNQRYEQRPWSKSLRHACGCAIRCVPAWRSTSRLYPACPACGDAPSTLLGLLALQWSPPRGRDAPAAGLSQRQVEQSLPYARGCASSHHHRRRRGAPSLVSPLRVSARDAPFLDELSPGARKVFPCAMRARDASMLHRRFSNRYDLSSSPPWRCADIRHRYLADRPTSP
jgi:hypothetical protein